MAQIDLQNIVVGYRKKGIHAPFSAKIPPGQVVVLAGRNGSGKSTLLKTLSGLLPPVSGSIKLNNTQLKLIPIAERAASISLVQTNTQFWTGLTVQEVLELGAEVNHSAVNSDKIEALTSFFGIQHVLDSSLNEISDGERQKTMIVRAILQDSSVLIMDEPTAFLDFPSKMKWWEYAQELKNNGKTLIISSHDISTLSSLPFIDCFWVIGEATIEAHNGDLSLTNLKKLLNSSL